MNYLGRDLSKANLWAGYIEPMAFKTKHLNRYLRLSINHEVQQHIIYNKLVILPLIGFEEERL